MSRCQQADRKPSKCCSSSSCSMSTNASASPGHSDSRDASSALIKDTLDKDACCTEVDNCKFDAPADGVRSGHVRVSNSNRPGCCSSTMIGSAERGCTEDSTKPQGMECCGEDHAPDNSRDEGDATSSFTSTTSALDCCTAKDGPCCDQECVLAYAKHDCMVASDEDHSKPPFDAPACYDHLQAALEKYGSMLEKAICLCRRVASSDIVRCCARKPTSSSVRKRCPTFKRRPATTEPKKESCDDACCDSKRANAVVTTPIGARPSKLQDIESIVPYEKVQLKVSGMTCTGCENKLQRVLNSLSGVTAADVVFVNNQASFEMDTSITDVETVVAGAQAKTGFHITRIRLETHSLDLAMTKSDAERLTLRASDSIIDYEFLDARTVRLFYDPHRVGAREILQKLGSHAAIAPIRSDTALQDEKKHLVEVALKTAIAAIFTVPVCVLAWAHTSIPEKSRAVSSLALASIVQIVGVVEFYTKAFKGLFHGHVLELDMLIVISITAAYVYSGVAFGFSIAGHPLAIGSFFETSTLLVTLVLLGRLIAGYARAKAVASVSLRSLQETLVKLFDADGNVQDIDTRLLQFGDVFRVMPHARVPTDSTVIEGSSEIDESMLTGESVKITKGEGSQLVAGTLNGDGDLKARVDRLPGKNTVSDIATMVEAAQASKPRVQAMADKIAGYFIPAVLTVALAVFAIQLAVSLRLRSEPSGEAVVSAVTYTIAVLAVSCPCALGLAVPVVLAIVGGLAARHGVVIKSASATERAWSTTDVVFDKTGTLTTGQFDVVAFEAFDDDALAISLAIAEISEHPVSSCVREFLLKRDLPAILLGQAKSIPGKGLTAMFDQLNIRAGSPAWLDLGSHTVVQSLLARGLTVFCVAKNDRVIAAFGLRGMLRPEAQSVVASLHSRGIVTHIVSGDAQGAVEDAAHSLGIENIRYQQSPAAKRDYVAQLAHPQGRRVLFCGDGTNDAVAIARADVGVCMGKASDISSSTADVTLLGTLRGLVFLLDISRAAYRRIIFNFVWSGIYNVLTILLAAGAFVTFRLPPAYAGLGEIVSVLPVIFMAATIFLSG